MKRTIFLYLFLLFGLVPGTLPAQSSTSFKLVIHGSNPTSSLSKAEVSRLFLKKVTRWEEDRKALPVDQKTGPLRERFSEEVHGMNVEATLRYWRQVMFSGRARPPEELASDREVLDFVKANPQAIGYVSVSTPTGEGVKVLEVTE